MKIDINHSDIKLHFGKLHNNGNPVSDDIHVFLDNTQFEISYYDTEYISIMLILGALDHESNNQFSINIPLLMYYDKSMSSFLELSCMSHDYETANLIEIRKETIRAAVMSHDYYLYPNEVIFHMTDLSFFNKYIFGMHWKDFIEQSTKHTCTVRVIKQ